MLNHLLLLQMIILSCIISSGLNFPIPVKFLSQVNSCSSKFILIHNKKCSTLQYRYFYVLKVKFYIIKNIYPGKPDLMMEKATCLQLYYIYFLKINKLYNCKHVATFPSKCYTQTVLIIIA